MSLRLPDPPLQEPIVEPPNARGAVPGTMTKELENYLRNLQQRAEQASYATVTAVELTGQAASIALTTLIALANGRYRVSYRFRVTTAAGVSSELRFTVTTTEGAVTCTQSSANYTGNAVNAPQSGSFIVHADANTPIQYSTTYVSDPAAAMVYELDVMVEAVA